MLTIKDCKDVMSKETLIGSYTAKDKKRKLFTFNAWMNEYSIWHDGVRIDSDPMNGRLLEEYNEL